MEKISHKIEQKIKKWTINEKEIHTPGATRLVGVPGTTDGVRDSTIQVVQSRKASRTGGICYRIKSPVVPKYLA